MSPSSPAGSSSSTLPISNTLLALPDGPIPSDHADRKSYTISYIGGYPSFPDTLNIPKEVTCGSCQSPIPLLAQVYCPPDGGENDRTVYVWVVLGLLGHLGGMKRMQKMSRRNELQQRQKQKLPGLKQRSIHLP
jgi:pre-rRNA-processing protein TSR4